MTTCLVEVWGRFDEALAMLETGRAAVAASLGNRLLHRWIEAMALDGSPAR